MAKKFIITIEAQIDEDQYNEKVAQGFTPKEINIMVSNSTKFSFPFLPIVDGEIVSVAMQES